MLVEVEGTEEDELTNALLELEEDDATEDIEELTTLDEEDLLLESAT